MSKMRDALAKAVKPRKLTTEERMAAAGYVSALVVSERLGMHLASVYRWVEEHQVESLKVLGKRYIKRSSLVNKLGVEQAKIFGFLVSP